MGEIELEACAKRVTTRVCSKDPPLSTSPYHIYTYILVRMAGSPAKQTSRSKRLSMTVMTTASNVAVMTSSKQSQTNFNSSSLSTDSDPNPKSTPVKRPSRQASLDNAHNISATNTPKPNSKLTKRPPAPSLSGNKGSPPKTKEPIGKLSEKSSRSSASLVLRGFSSTLHPKAPAPSSLPKYKGKSTNESSGEQKSSRKRSTDWESDKEETRVNDGKKLATDEDEDEDGDFVQVERPVSPLPRRATRKPLLPVSLSLASSASLKKPVLHKSSKSLDSPRLKAPKTTLSPVPRSVAPRPASASSQRATPVSNSGKKTLRLNINSPLSRNTRRRVSPPEVAKLDSSPSNPFHIPETSGTSLLSPPLSPFLESASLDSIDANDVSALLTTVMSPIKPPVSNTTDRTGAESGKSPLQIKTENANNIFPALSTSTVPQTPLPSRSVSIMSTDPRHSILSIQQLLEKSGDIDHLLSQPLPSIFTPEVRERLLSFGFSPDGPPPPIAFALRPEPQTPSPPPDGRNNYSISQVLFPGSEGLSPSTPTGTHTADTLQATLQDLRAQLSTAKLIRSEQQERIQELEKRIANLHESREREASDLALQVKVLEERIHQLLADKERESEEKQYGFELELKEKDNQWQDKLLAAITQISNTHTSMRERDQATERTRSSLLRGIAAWGHVDEIARSELALVNANRQSIGIVMSSLDIFVQKLRLSTR